VETLKEGNVILLRFSDGEDLVECAKQALKKAGVTSGVVLGGVGMLSSPGLAFYKGSGVYEPIPVGGEVELVALNGNVAMLDGDIFLHLHATLAGADGRAVAGHFTGGKVHMTAEVAIMRLEKKMVRVLDEETGLKTLRFE
jgi:predicted DNA-binding protein with PD1-like motif